jgi:hypothetical protein
MDWIILSRCTGLRANGWSGSTTPIRSGSGGAASRKTIGIAYEL